MTQPFSSSPEQSGPTPEPSHLSVVRDNPDLGPDSVLIWGFGNRILESKISEPRTPEGNMAIRSYGDLAAKKDELNLDEHEERMVDQFIDRNNQRFAQQ